MNYFVFSVIGEFTVFGWNLGEGEARKCGAGTYYDILSSQGDPTKLSQVFLQDFSKYGTSVNGVRISGTVHLKNGDEVLFGKNNSHYRWVVDCNPVNELSVCLRKFCCHT